MKNYQNFIFLFFKFDLNIFGWMQCITKCDDVSSQPSNTLFRLVQTDFSYMVQEHSKQISFTVSIILSDFVFISTHSCKGCICYCLPWKSKWSKTRCDYTETEYSRWEGRGGHDDLWHTGILIRPEKRGNSPAESLNFAKIHLNFPCESIIWG